MTRASRRWQRLCATRIPYGDIAKRRREVRAAATAALRSELPAIRRARKGRAA